MKCKYITNRHIMCFKYVLGIVLSVLTEPSIKSFNFSNETHVIANLQISVIIFKVVYI